MDPLQKATELYMGKRGFLFWANKAALWSVGGLLVGILDKIGTFGMLRFCLGIFPEASDWATPLVVTLALISIVYGALLAIGQDDMFRLIGLTSLSHFGLITLGIFTMSSQGGTGSILYMVNHGLGTAALFLLALLLDCSAVVLQGIAGVQVFFFQ